MGVTRQSFPKENAADLTAFFGEFDLDANGVPTAAWQRDNLTRVVCPWRLSLSWDTTKTASGILCHKKVAISLTEVLDDLWQKHQQSQAQIDQSRLNLYGGCYEFRRKRGLSGISLHAYGAAIDLDPEHNPLGKKWQPNTGMMPDIAIETFQAAGWKWGGTFSGRKDPMHFQATS